MSHRNFHLRMKSSYESDDNNIKDIQIEVLHDEQWEPLDLGIRSPGFLLYINALFSCQHLYMRANSAERDIILNSSTGELRVKTDESWHLQDIEVNFDALIKSGVASDDDIGYISERMNHCPVSTNLPEGIKMDITVKFL